MHAGWVLFIVGWDPQFGSATAFVENARVPGPGWLRLTSMNHRFMKIMLLLASMMAFSAIALAPYKLESSWLIYSSPSPTTTPTLEIWAVPGEKMPKKWRLMNQGTSGRLLAEMVEPTLPAGYVYNYGECWYHGQFRYDVIAQVKHGNSAKSKVIAKIWLIDPAASTFRLLPGSQGFECDHVGYGI